MRWTATLILILCSGCHVARATVTYHGEDTSISFTIEPETRRNSDGDYTQAERIK